VSRYQKGKTNLDFTEARGSEWQWHQLGHVQHSRQIPRQHPTTRFLQAGCPSCRPTNSVKALKAKTIHRQVATVMVATARIAAAAAQTVVFRHLRRRAPPTLPAVFTGQWIDTFPPKCPFSAGMRINLACSCTVINQPILDNWTVKIQQLQ